MVVAFSSIAAGARSRQAAFRSLAATAPELDRERASDGEISAALSYLAADVESIAARLPSEKGRQLLAISRLIRSLAD